MGFFKKLFGKKEKNSEQSCQTTPNKQYIDFDMLHNKELVHLESAYRHQEIVFRRATETNRITLGEILTGLFKTESTSIESLAIMYRLGFMNDDKAEELIFNDLETIWNYDIFACILKNKTEDGHYTNGLFHETTLVVKCKEKNYILAITSLGGIDTLKYLRVSLMSPDNSDEDDCASLKTNNSNNNCIYSFVCRNSIFCRIN